MADIRKEADRFVYGIRTVCPNGICSSSLKSCSCPSGFKPIDSAAWSLGYGSAGCTQNVSLNCTKDGSNDVFVGLNKTSFQVGPGGREEGFDGKSQTWCERRCLDDCNCIGYAYRQNSSGTTNCSTVSETMFLNSQDSSNTSSSFFIRLSSRQSLPAATPSPKGPRAAAPPSPGSGPKRARKGLIPAFVSAAGALLLAVLAGLWWLRGRNSKIEAQRTRSEETLSATPHKFCYKDLQIATKNFSQQLGKGGFGAVYKGWLPDNSTIAVKKIYKMNKQEREFYTEVVTIGSIHHVNLVRLRGFCSEGKHRLLVYGYLENGSLERLLFKSNPETPVIDWSTRFGIALGAARALAYLHEECRDRIIHCDIKPENILLDDNFCVKVSDFGLAKLMGRELSHVITNMRGTRGYVAPEWLENKPITAKVDVYSFGMTLLEILSGRRNTDLNQVSSDKWFFPIWAFNNMTKGPEPEIHKLADERMGSSIDEEQLRKAILVAFWCIQDDPQLRPSMEKVVQILEGSLEVTQPPLPFKSIMLQTMKKPTETESSSS